MKYAYSDYSEGPYCGEFQSIESAIHAAKDNGAAYSCHVAEVHDYTHSSLGDDVIEMMAERAENEVGDAADGWPCLTTDEKKELGEMINAYVLSKSKIDFFGIKNAKEHLLSHVDEAGDLETER